MKNINQLFHNLCMITSLYKQNNVVLERQISFHQPSEWQKWLLGIKMRKAKI